MRDILKRKMKKYKYKIIFKNKNEAEGTITARNLTKVYDILCKNKFTQVDNNTKAFYWNANEINTLEVNLLKEDIKE